MSVLSFRYAKIACSLTLMSPAWLVPTVTAQPLPLPDVPPAITGAPEPGAPEPGTLADDLRRNPACSERTNGCEVCIGGQDGKLSCSLPGIACQPGLWRCAPLSEISPAARRENR
ncbi:MAG: hypothetical protein R3D44_07460 [Hyphomicrobiaceae bacterium]